MQRARCREVVGGVQARQQAADRAGALHLGCQRRRRVGRVVGGARHQRHAAFAQFAQRLDQGFRRVHQHRLDQLPERLRQPTFERTGGLHATLVEAVFGQAPANFSLPADLVSYLARLDAFIAAAAVIAALNDPGASTGRVPTDRG